MRDVICADAIEWLNSIDKLDGSVFTSLPDISELPNLSSGSVNERIVFYENWFVNTATKILKLLSDKQYAIFLQSDVRVQSEQGDVSKWIDKSHLCSIASDSAGCTLRWHKIVTRKDVDARSFGRPTYSHLLCYSKDASYDSGAFATPDIFDRGEMLWPKGIGLDCCFAGVAFLKRIAKANLVIDPFCGYGTVLAMSNALGLPSLGVEISTKRCKKARSLDLRDKLAYWSRGHMSMLGLPKYIELPFELRVGTSPLTAPDGDGHDELKRQRRSRGASNPASATHHVPLEDPLLSSVSSDCVPLLPIAKLNSEWRCAVESYCRLYTAEAY